MAAARILEAQAQLGVTRADQFPDVSAGVDVLGERPSVALGFPAKNIGARRDPGVRGVGAGFLGQVPARHRGGARAAARRRMGTPRRRLDAGEPGRRAATSACVRSTSSWTISRRTLASRQESLKLAQAREQGGVTSLLDVRQAEQLVYGATGGDRDARTGDRAAGEFPQRARRRQSGPDRARPRADRRSRRHLDVPAGLPSALIERRPDVQRAEQQLVAANAQIGVARAAYFPQIDVDGIGRLREHRAGGAVHRAPTSIWTAAASLTQPIFTAGRTRSQVAVAPGAPRRGGHRVSADRFARRSRKCPTRSSATASCASSASSRRCCSRRRRTRGGWPQVRYEGGATSYLEVLDADTRLFDAELGLVQAELSERSALVEIYRALGGGWQA